MVEVCLHHFQSHCCCSRRVLEQAPQRTCQGMAHPIGVVEHKLWVVGQAVPAPLLALLAFLRALAPLNILAVLAVLDAGAFLAAPTMAVAESNLAALAILVVPP